MLSFEREGWSLKEKEGERRKSRLEDNGKYRKRIGKDRETFNSMEKM